MRVVVSVGGSVLAPGLSEGDAAERVAGYAAAIDRLGDHSIGVVVGGGRVAREYIETARSLGANEVELDDIGIAVTRLNARLLAAALDDAAPVPAESYETARAALEREETAVMGGIVAGQTTDAVAAALAEYVGADLLVYATSVAGVFSADPEDPDAVHQEQLTPRELIDIIADIEMAAGSSAPVDLLAAKIIERSGVPTVVLNGSDPDRLVEAVRDGSHGGTEIVPE
ncbi:MAG: UMP kinase [Halobacteriaceae archaeon]